MVKTSLFQRGGVPSIHLISNLTGKNFLVDEKVRGKVTVISPRPVNLDEVYNVFLSILEVQRLTVVPQGPITKIVPSREVKERPLPSEINGQRDLLGLNDAFVTQLILLEHADANDIRGLLASLMSKEGGLLSPTTSLVRKLWIWVYKGAVCPSYSRHFEWVQ